MRFIIFETKRFLANPKNKIVLGLLVLVFFASFGFSQLVSKQRFLEAELAGSRFNLQQSTQNLQQLEETYRLNPENEELSKRIEKARKEQDLFSQQLYALERNDSNQYAKIETQLIKEQISTKDKDDKDYQELQSKIAYYDRVEKAGGSHSSTINNVDESAFRVASSLMSLLSSIVVYILVAVLVSDTLSHEIESNQIRFDPLRGKRTVTQLFLKLLIPSTITFIVTIFSFFIIYVIHGCIHTFGSWDYPYFFPDRSMTAVGVISFYSLTFYWFAILFLSSLGQLLSLLFRKSLVVIGLIALLLTGFLTLSQEEWFQTFKVYLPFEYLGYGHMRMDASILPQQAVLIGILYLGGLIFLFFLLASYLYRHYYHRREGNYDRASY